MSINLFSLSLSLSLSIISNHNQFTNVLSARSEMGKTKEQLAEDKRIAMSFRVKPLDIDNLSLDDLKKKATQLWDMIVQLESDKYDLEERQKRQDYDVKFQFVC